VFTRFSTNSRLQTDKCPKKLSTTHRYWLTWQASWLLASWPTRFISICKTYKILSSVLLRDMGQVPFWFQKIVNDYLFKGVYHIANREIATET